jgi:hypothetical protein
MNITLLDNLNISYLTCQHKFLLLFIMFVNIGIGRDFTKPPSVALRTEFSYVSVVQLSSKKSLTKGFELNFSLLNDLFNRSNQKIIIVVDKKLESTLEPNKDYIIAYQRFKKTKIEGIPRIVSMPNGPSLLNVEGASPAIFSNNALLAKQLKINPDIAKKDPQLLIDIIFKGISEEDPKIQEFFVRELINWGVIQKNLSRDNFKSLYDVFTSINATPGTLIALLEARANIHKGMSVKKMQLKVKNVLDNIPVNLDQSSETPTLIMRSLDFLKRNNLGDQKIYSRWVRCNIPTISELALLSLSKIDLNKALELANKVIEDSSINSATRRVLKRFIKQYRTSLVDH